MKTINISSPNSFLTQRQFREKNHSWGAYRFLFNAHHQAYDYLVCYGDLDRRLKPLCPLKNTLHIATEPPWVHSYAPQFLNQFAHVVTVDPAVKHEGSIFSQLALPWRIGMQEESTNLLSLMYFDDIASLIQRPKTKRISCICSQKQTKAEHAKRLRFVEKLQKHYGESIDFFGRGSVSVEDKLDALLEYRFSIVLENSSYDHYFTEKLSDCILAGSYPIYYGCPNIHSYFPENSLQVIDIDDFEKAVAVIDETLAQDYDKKYRSQLLAAHNLVCTEYNIFPTIIHLLESIAGGAFGEGASPQIPKEGMLPFASRKFYKVFNKSLKARVLNQLKKFAYPS